MTVTLHEATRADKPVLRRLLELCLHDISEFEPADLDERGRFGYPYLDAYWTEPERYPLLVRADGRLAGFALVNGHTYLDGTDHALAEFFVVRRYRRRGVGCAAAGAVFDRFPGVWEVRVSEANAAGQAFWYSVLATHMGAEPEPRRGAAWAGVLYQFPSARQR